MGIKVNYSNQYLTSLKSLSHLPYRLQRKIKIKFYQHAVFKMVSYLLAAFLLERFMFSGSVYPAGIALALTQRKWLIQERLVLLTGIFLADLGIFGSVSAIFRIIPLVIFYLIDIIYWQRKPRRSRLSWILVWSALRILATAMETLEPHVFITTFWELGYSIVLVFLFQNGIKFLENPLKPSKTSFIGIILLIGLCIGGTKDLLGIFNITEFITIWLLMTISFIGGGGVGAIMGVSLAIILGVATGGILSTIAFYSVPGMLGGLLKDFGRWGTFFGAALGLFLVTKETQTLLTLGQALPWGMGMASFLMMPRRYFSELSNYIPEQVSPGEKLEQQDQLSEIVTNRLNEVATAFSDLSKSFAERCAQDESIKVDLYSLLEQVCCNICQHCNGYEKCWGEHFYSTYREIFDLIALAELYGEVHSHQLKGRLSKNCFQQYKLVTTVNKMVEKYQTNTYWRRRFEEEKKFITGQIDSVSEFISNLANEITQDNIFKANIELKLKTGLNRIGIHVKDIYIHSFGREGLEIRIKQRNCYQKQECQCLIAPLISKILGTDYMIWEKRCNLENEECAYCLIPMHIYEVKTTVCKMPKNGNDASGDSHALHELKDGFFVSILSDGMGHGNKAAQESNATVTILERLLDTGIDRNFAVKMVNSMMSLRSPEESFATVDLAIIDLYNGSAEFLKIGAAATYVKRGREVMVIKSTSLPAGILNTVDVEKTVMELKPGDIIVMVTDGVVDSKQDVTGKEEWVKRALAKVEVVGPEALGEYLLNMAKINQDGVPKDDMTVIVLQIFEKQYNFE